MGHFDSHVRRQASGLRGLSAHGARLLAALAVVGAVLAVPARGEAAASQYPDLRTSLPADLRLDQIPGPTGPEYVLRLTNAVWNAGEGPLEVYGAPDPADGRTHAWQRIYESPAGFRDEYVGEFVWHPAHQHFHFENFARYELWSRAELELALQTGFARGSPQQVSPKVSFCLEDSDHVDPARGPGARVYATCNPSLQGISVGWADIYPYYLPEQWIQLGAEPLRDGSYAVRSVVDPNNLLFESEGRSDAARESHQANAAVTWFRVVGGSLRIDTGPSGRN
jgi:Lysyl oxidase